MSTTKHTPGPWQVGLSKHGHCAIAPGLSPMPAVFTARNEANAARIVACVNACEGINPEAVPEILDVMRRIAESNGSGEGCGDLFQRWVIDALAKAEGR